MTLLIPRTVLSETFLKLKRVWGSEDHGGYPFGKFGATVLTRTHQLCLWRHSTKNKLFLWKQFRPRELPEWVLETNQGLADKYFWELLYKKICLFEDSKCMKKQKKQKPASNFDKEMPSF